MPITAKTRSFYVLLKVITISIGMLLLYTGLLNCAEKIHRDWGVATDMPNKPIQEVLKEHHSKLMSIPGVVGTAQSLCEGKPCIKVFVSEKTGQLEEKIPKTLEGYPVVIQETGKFKALPGN